MPKIEREVIIVNSQGLHARPAALFVQIASKYDSAVTVCKDNESVNGKSIMGILMLGAKKGSTVVLMVEGEDAEPAFNELEAFLKKED